MQGEGELGAVEKSGGETAHGHAVVVLADMTGSMEIREIEIVFLLEGWVEKELDGEISEEFDVRSENDDSVVIHDLTSRTDHLRHVIQ